MVEHEKEHMTNTQGLLFCRSLSLTHQQYPLSPHTHTRDYVNILYTLTICTEIHLKHTHTYTQTLPCSVFIRQNCLCEIA